MAFIRTCVRAIDQYVFVFASFNRNRHEITL